MLRPPVRACSHKRSPWIALPGVDRGGVTTDVTARWMGVGNSADADAFTAGRVAAERASAGRAPELLLVYASTGYDLERLVDGARGCAADGTVIAGCTTLGEVVEGRSHPLMSGVVVAALGGPGLQVRAAVGHHVSTRRREAGAEAAASLAGIEAPNRTCLLL